jgi:hypothetical protein
MQCAGTHSEAPLDTTPLTNAFALLDEVLRALPPDSPVREQGARLRRELTAFEIEHSTLATENARLRKLLESLTRSHTELEDAFAHLSTDELDRSGYLWRRSADGGKLGPYCPRHRDVLLTQTDDRCMGMYCRACGDIILDQAR